MNGLNVKILLFTKVLCLSDSLTRWTIAGEENLVNLKIKVSEKEVSTKYK